MSLDMLPRRNFKLDVQRIFMSFKKLEKLNLAELYERYQKAGYKDTIVEVQDAENDIVIMQFSVNCSYSRDQDPRSCLRCVETMDWEKEVEEVDYEDYGVSYLKESKSTQTMLVGFTVAGLVALVVGGCTCMSSVVFIFVILRFRQNNRQKLWFVILLVEAQQDRRQTVLNPQTQRYEGSEEFQLNAGKLLWYRVIINTLLVAHGVEAIETSLVVG